MGHSAREATPTLTYTRTGGHPVNLTTSDILLALIAIALWVALFTGWDGI